MAMAVYHSRDVMASTWVLLETPTVTVNSIFVHVVRLVTIFFSPVTPPGIYIIISIDEKGVAEPN